MGDYTAVIDKKNSLKAICCKSRFEEDDEDKDTYLFIVKQKLDGDDENT